MAVLGRKRVFRGKGRVSEGLREVGEGWKRVAGVGKGLSELEDTWPVMEEGRRR